MRVALPLVLVSSIFIASAGCSSEAPPAAGSAKPSATAATAAKPTATATAAATATATASALPPRDDCPKGSAGPGTLTQPCAGTGTMRMMTVKWTGKTDDKGPYFSVTNNSPAVILYGKIAVYFYDKDGKQLETKSKGADGKETAVPFKTCFGNIFSGVMKVKENAVLTFSCVKKEDVPEGTTAIEGEMTTVGFADANGEKSEFYWANFDIAPSIRAKGGVK
jgi:hypothetical protein